MNLLEFVCFLLLVALVILSSRGLGYAFGIPEAASVIPIGGFLMVLLRVFTKIPTRALLILSSLIVTVSLLSLGLARVLGLRESIVATPVAGGFVLLVIQSRLRVWRRTRPPDKNTDQNN